MISFCKLCNLIVEKIDYFIYEHSCFFSSLSFSILFVMQMILDSLFVH